MANRHVTYIVVVTSFSAKGLNHQIKKYGIFAEIAKFYACQIFLLYSNL